MLVLSCASPVDLSYHDRLVHVQVDWHMQATCATTGDGLSEGFDWIAQRLRGDKAPPRRVMR